MNEEIMQSGEITKLIEWLRAEGHTTEKILECVEFVTGKDATLEEFKNKVSNK